MKKSNKKIKSVKKGEKEEKKKIEKKKSSERINFDGSYNMPTTATNPPSTAPTTLTPVSRPRATPAASELAVPEGSAAALLTGLRVLVVVVLPLTPTAMVRGPEVMGPLPEVAEAAPVVV